MFAVANQGGQMSRAGLRARSFHLLVDPTGVWLTPPGSVGEMAVSHFAGFAMFLVGALVFIAIHSRRPPTAGPLRASGPKGDVSANGFEFVIPPGRLRDRRVGRTLPKSCRCHGLDEGSRLCASCRGSLYPAIPPAKRWAAAYRRWAKL